LRSFCILALAVMLAGPAAAQAADPAAVVAAERAFAADGLALGMRDSFLKHAAPDAIVFRPDPVRVHEVFGKAPPDRDDPALSWWPVWAGVARSGDLGFTTGPFALDGKRAAFYFTIWRRQPDGTWRWVFDGGPPSDPSEAGAAGSPVAYLPTSTREGGSETAAEAEVSALEAALNERARTDLRGALAPVVAADTWLAGGRTAPENSPAGQARELALRPTAVIYQARAVDASAAGDLAWTWGEASWARDGAQQRGHYVRVWQARPEGWRLVYDSLLPKPPR
jgi:ketosteroid isomerase-like protein